MAARTRKKPTPAPTPTAKYVGAATCDLVMEWDADPADTGLLAMLRACDAADPDDLTPQLVLADMLGERGDSREGWVRAGCALWAACRELAPHPQPWDFTTAKAVLSAVTGSSVGWRVACLWGSLVAWHAPAGDETGLMGRTWVDARVGFSVRGVYWWSLGLAAREGSQAYAAWRQAYAAGSQAYAAGSQADAAWSQADAAGSQADAAGSQAYAAGSQADAAWSQADAAWRQADAAGRQAYAAGRQADAAGRQAYAAGRQAYAAGSQAYAAQQLVWRFARAAWGLCEPWVAKLGS